MTNWSKVNFGLRPSSPGGARGAARSRAGAAPVRRGAAGRARRIATSTATSPGPRTARGAGLQDARVALGDPGAELARAPRRRACRPSSSSAPQGREPDVVVRAGTARRSSPGCAVQMWAGSGVTAGVVGSSEERSAEMGRRPPRGRRRAANIAAARGPSGPVRRRPDARRKSRRKPRAELCTACARRVDGRVDDAARARLAPPVTRPPRPP